jgi:hypothetical protein
MKVSTWGRDSHNLFDYESKNLNQQTITINNEIVVMRHGNELETFDYDNTTTFE